MMIFTAINGGLLLLLILLCSLVQAIWLANVKTLAAIEARPCDFTLEKIGARPRRRRQGGGVGHAKSASAVR